jgi:hypothetical protein
MSDIFLSYTEHDRDTVRRLAQTLEAVGWTVWWDRRIPAGQTWREVLEREMQSMHCMVVLWSSRSVKSDWVCEEAAEARQLDRLVPVLIERVRPPAGFREVQAADLIDWDGARDFPGLQQLINDLEQKIGKPDTQQSDVPQPRPPMTTDASGSYPRVAVDVPIDEVPRPSPPRRNLLPWGAAAGIVVIAGAAYLGTVRRDPVPISPDPPPTNGAPAPSQGEAKTQAIATVPPTTDKSSVKEANKPPPIDSTEEKAAKASAIEAKKKQEAAEMAKAAKKRQEEIAKAKAAQNLAGSNAQSPANSKCAALNLSRMVGQTLSSESQSFFDKECLR